jgi:hypothetical protein
VCSNIRTCNRMHPLQTGGQPTNHTHENALLHQNTLPTLADVGICWSMQVTNTGHSRLAMHSIIIPTCNNVRHKCELLSCMHASTWPCTHHRSVSGITSSVRTAPSDRQAAQTDACTCVHTLSGIAQSIFRSRPTGHRAMHSIALAPRVPHDGESQLELVDGTHLH